jgi:peptidoglycan/xylan/chitin deacetylase (PgdA/CDA1 family)
MNAPYVPTGKLTTRFNRHWARIAARAPLSVRLDRPIVTFTFDDFPKSAAQTGARMLEERDWRGTYYASAAYAGGLTHHGAMFDAGDLQRLVTAGHEIGCHTYEHLDCAAADLDTITKSVACNARALASMGLETSLESFAFPYGEATAHCKQNLGEKFTALRGIRAAVNRGTCDRNLLAAIPIDGGEAGIERAIDAANSLSSAPGWLIYYAHDIQDEPTEWGCTPDQFERVCKAVEQSGARVQTLTSALKTLENNQ